MMGRRTGHDGRSDVCAGEVGKPWLCRGPGDALGGQTDGDLATDKRTHPHLLGGRQTGRAATGLLSPSRRGRRRRGKRGKRSEREREPVSAAVVRPHAMRCRGGGKRRGDREQGRRGCGKASCGA